jgi:hypothetical protein
MWGFVSGGVSPLVSIFQVFYYIDRKYNREQLVGCIDYMRRIEKALQDPKGGSLGALSVDLNKLNTKISELRACVQYVKTSMETMRIRKRLAIELALHNAIVYFTKICDQRLLDLDTITQRLNISLSVVSSSISQNYKHATGNIIIILARYPVSKLKTRTNGTIIWQRHKRLLLCSLCSSYLQPFSRYVDAFHPLSPSKAKITRKLQRPNDKNRFSSPSPCSTGTQLKVPS